MKPHIHNEFCPIPCLTVGTIEAPIIPFERYYINDLGEALVLLSEYAIVARDIATRCIYRVNGVTCDPLCRGKAVCGERDHD